MSDIEIERFEPEKLDIYKASGEFYGTLNNESEFNKFRLKMVTNDVTDEYYFMFNNIKITIDLDGNMSNLPYGLWDSVGKDLAALIRISREKAKDRKVRKEIKDRKEKLKKI